MCTIFEDKNFIDEVKSKLSFSNDNYHIPHAIIIESKDSDKLVVAADVIAKLAVCLSDDKPCDACRACLKVKKDIHPDVLKISGVGVSNSIGVDIIREVRDMAYVMSNEARCKVYILENACGMTMQAQNALLKILEEPPSDVIFILLCDSDCSLLETIRSRCIKLSFNSEFKLDDAEIYRLSEKVLHALCNLNEYNLLISVSTCVKNKEIFCKLLDYLLNIFGDAAVASCGAVEDYVNSEYVVRISNKFTSYTILQLIEVVVKTKEYLEKNVNINLLVTSFAIDLYNTAAG